MSTLRCFIDTHDREQQTFPPQLSAAEFESFYSKYEEACAAEGVISLRVHVGLEQGRAFCLTMAPDEDAVRRAHARVGLPFDSITEVRTATPADLFYQRD
ncbi:MAG: DUF4242 domain-containing protein [Hydrogenophaga sp.]|nr:DUF4242 domain-containing protein [Hydrogenophaga sp.]